MAKASISVTEDQLICPVCLDLLNCPVAIPCGHSYCMSCITNYWNQKDQKRDYSCPQCIQSFSSRPSLNKNTILAEMVEKLKKTEVQADVTAQCSAGDVPCDVSTEINTKHKNHDTVSAAAERTEKQRILGDTKRKHHQRMEQIEKELKDLRDVIESYKQSAQTAVEDSKRIFTQLIRSIEKKRSEVIQLIRDQEKTAVSRAEEQLERLMREIDDLRRRDAELEKLSQTDDHIHFLQDEPSITFTPQLSFKDVRKSVSILKEELEDFYKEIDKISDRVTCIKITPPNEPKTRQEFLQYFGQLTLDTNTVNKKLHLSEKNRRVSWTERVQQYPDHPDRFDGVCQVLCKESLCERCYWEIEFSADVSGVGISVSYKSISRKGRGDECEFGHNNQSWSLFFYDSRCSFYHNNKHNNLFVDLSSCIIGVYVDYSAGSLSFYRVSDTMKLIHRVHTTFTQPLYPGFTVYRGSTVKLCDVKI
ncbi:E3 ubiquitin-protein ligase TRIM65-like [Paramisgurnus dabryanus]|uniref:E3 ubiquitin-protein ligase TRIM65-like n=1 Tax=Paramisgurnus dabryanus TaxID=90735 RepID=UPI003CCFA02E